MVRRLSTEEKEKRKKILCLYLRAHYGCTLSDLVSAGLNKYLISEYQGEIGLARKEAGLTNYLGLDQKTAERLRIKYQRLEERLQKRVERETQVDQERKKRLEYILQRRRTGINKRSIGAELGEVFGKSISGDGVYYIIKRAGLEDPWKNPYYSEYTNPALYISIKPHHERGLSPFLISKKISKCPGTIDRCLRYNGIKPHKLRTRKWYKIPNKIVKRVLIYYFIDGLSQKEAGKNCGISQKGVASLIQRLSNK